MQHRSFGLSDFQTRVLHIYKLRLQAEMLRLWVDVIFSRSNPLMSYWSVLSASNGGPWNPKLTLKINSLQIKHKAQNFASWMFSEYAFKIKRKKRKWFFDHSTTLNIWKSVPYKFHYVRTKLEGLACLLFLRQCISNDTSHLSNNSSQNCYDNLKTMFPFLLHYYCIKKVPWLCS